MAGLFRVWEAADDGLTQRNDIPASNLFRWGILDLNRSAPMSRYPRALAILHWLMVPLMIAGFILGEVMEELPRGAARQAALGWHILLGLLVLALVLPRLLARRAGVPEPLPGTSPAASLAARVAHGALYATMILLPILGVLSIVTGSRTVPVLDLFGMPSLWPLRWLHEAAEELHGGIAKLFLGTLVLHVLAVLWHGFVRRDETLKRMMPFGG